MAKKPMSMKAYERSAADKKADKKNAKKAGVSVKKWEGSKADEKIDRAARLMTDEAPLYKRLGWNFADHGQVTHARDEYVSRQDPTVHTQTVEGFYSIFKRGMRGVYQHASKKHLHRYAAEFDFRYSNRIALGVDDEKRTALALQGVVGKRLRYRGGAYERPQAQA